MVNEELRRAQEALDASQTRYIDLYDQAPVGYLTISKQGLILEANLTAATQLRVPRDALIKQPLVRFILAEDQEIYRQSRRQLYETGKPQECELRLTRKNGSPFWARMEAIVTREIETGTAVCRATISDITDHKQAESLALATIEALTAHICVLDENGTILAVNEAWRRFGRDNPPVPDNAFVGENYFSVCDRATGPDSKEATPFAAGLRALMRGEVEEFEMEYPCHAPGDPRWFIGKATRLQGGSPSRLVVAHENITERKRAEDALREIEERLSVVFHASPISIAITRLRDNQYVDVNEAWQNVTGYTRQEAIGHTPSELRSWVKPEEREQLIRELRAHGTVCDFQFQRKHKSGVVSDMLLSAELIQLAGEACMLSMAQDITAHKLVEENLREMTKRVLDAQDNERRRIARELHDSTAQQLVAMTMNLEMLEDALPRKNPRVKKLLHDSLALAEQCTREVRTISYLLHPPLLDQLGLTAALRSYIDGFSKRSGIQVTMDNAEGLGRFPAEVELALFRVVQESLANIHRHSGSRTADVRFLRTGEHVTVEVSDKGRGISSDILTNIQQGAVGPGMGIAGMRERLRQLGGNLEMESDSHGTTIRAKAPVGK
jgi:PAS domain S-box-containing protein